MDKTELKRRAYSRVAKIKNIQNETRYIETIEIILRLYEKILDLSTGSAACGIEKFDFNEMIGQSPFSNTDKKSVRLLELQYNLDKLAQVWDEWVNKHRTDVFPKAEHLFFLTYYRQQKDKAFYVDAFNSLMSPDSRLVAITIPDHRFKLNYTPILHEMGHVIGCRKRSKRKENIFIFLLLSILSEIFKAHMAEHYGLKPGAPMEIPPLNDRNAEFYQKEWWAYGKKICADLRTLYNVIVSLIMPTISDHEGVKCYAELFVTNIREKIVELLNDDAIWTDNLSAEYGVLLHKTYKSIVDLVPVPFATQGDNTIDVFEEPVADCFMVKIQGISPREYLKMVIDEALYTWNQTKKGRSDESFLQYMASDILRHRILSVTYAMIEERAENASVDINSREEKERFKDEIREKEKTALFHRTINSFGTKYKAYKMFEAMYKQQEALMRDMREINVLDIFIERLLNPQKIISTYISTEVFRHEHFDEIDKAPLVEYVKAIRKLT